MRIYEINPVGGGIGFKVHITDDAGGLRVVGIFPSHDNAEAWIATDRDHTGAADINTAPEPVSHAYRYPAA